MSVRGQREIMLEGWKVHLNVMRHNGRDGGGITTLGAWRTISKDADCLPQLSLFNKASTCVCTPLSVYA